MTGQCLGLLTGQTIMQTIRFLLDHSRNGHGHKRFLCGLPTQKRDWNSCPRTIKLNSLRLILVVWDWLAMCLCSRRMDAKDRRLCWSFSAVSAGTQMKCCPVLSPRIVLFLVSERASFVFRQHLHWFINIRESLNYISRLNETTVRIIIIGMGWQWKAFVSCDCFTDSSPAKMVIIIPCY